MDRNINSKTTQQHQQRRRNVDNHQELLRHASATLGSGNIREAVKLPHGEDVNEWIAVNIVDFFNQICMLYGTISESCTAETCPKMNAGSQFEYFWTDEKSTTISCSAPVYIGIGCTVYSR